MNASTQASTPPRGFEDFSDADVRELIAHYPLAWVIARDGAPAAPSLLPLIGHYDDAGTLVELVGHCAAANPLVASLAMHPHALVLFNGPQGYVSPEHARRDDWAPTWNYAQLTIEADIGFDAGETEAALDMLIEPMERGRVDPWDKSRIGARYDGMLRAIIGFRARVISVQGKFKLGQDERPETLRAILDHHPDPALSHWMRRFNADRL